MKDVLIVGNGLAANVMAFQLYQHQLSFTIIGDKTASLCSSVAAGVWNPMVFKRMTTSWMAESFIDELLAFYGAAEVVTKTSFLTERQIVRHFNEAQEMQLWQKKASAEAAPFLDKVIYTSVDKRLIGCETTGAYSFVNRCGNLHVEAFIAAMNNYFKDHFLPESFDYAQLEINANGVIHNKITYRYVVFCEGHLVKHNPFFYWIPLVPAKGELLELNVPGLHLDYLILNRDGFLFQQNEVCKLGATYEWNELNDMPSEQGKQELLQKLKGMTQLPYQIINHKAGVRPSSKDRRPIIGVHPQHSQLLVFNGLGSKGVMLAPYFSKNFVHFLLGKSEIHKDVSVSRFYSHFKN